MKLLTTTTMVGFAPAPTQPGQKAPPVWMNLLPLRVFLVVVFYFALIRPQQKKAKDHTNLLQGLRPGDKVVTTGGMVATVITVKERTVTVRSADSKLEITKSAVAEITERSGPESQS